MEEELIQLRSLAFFANQMLICLVRNVVENGVYPPNVARTNIQEVIDQATRTLSAEHHAEITKVAGVYVYAIGKGEEDLKRHLGE